MKEKDKKEWLDLYALAKEILDLKPWQKLWDTNICSYIDENGEQYYFCTMGKGGEFHGISIYKGDEVRSLFDFASSKYPDSIVINYQRCLNIFFGERYKMTPGNKALIKELGLSFRKTWIGFEKFRKGYDVLTYSMEDVRTLLHILPHYLEVVKDLMGLKNKPELETYCCYTRFYDADKKEYVHEIQDLLPPLPKKVEKISLPTSVKKKAKELKKGKVTTLEVEFTNALPILLEDLEGRFPYITFIGDAESGFIFRGNLEDKKTFASEQKFVLNFVQILLDTLEKIGVPQMICVRDEEAYAYLEELGKLLGCEVVISPRMKMLDQSLEMLIEQL